MSSTSSDGARAPCVAGATPFGTFFEALPLGAFVVDPYDGTIVDCNEQAAAQLGYAREEFVGLNVTSLNAALAPPDVLDRLQKIAAGGRPLRYEAVYRTKAGELRAMLVTAKPIDCCGVVRALVAIVDVTDERVVQRRLDEARRRDAEFARSEATLNAVLDALPVGVVIADANGRVLRDNAAHRDLWGIGPAASHWSEYGHWVGYWPATGERLKAHEWAMSRALVDGAVVRDELIECERFGTRERRRYLANAAPIRDETGAIVAGVLVELDVTERQAAERRSAEDAERVQLALDAGAIIGTWDWDLIHDHFTADERFARSFGLDAGRCRAGLGIHDVVASVHPEDKPRLMQAIAEAFRRGGAYRCVYRTRQHDGVYRWIEANGRVELAADGTPLRFPGVLLDMQERHAADEQLAASEARFRAAVAAASEIFWTNDANGRMRGEQPSWTAFTGQTIEQYEGYGWTAALHPDDVANTIEVWEAAVAVHAKFVCEHRLRRHDGVYRTFSVRALPVFDADETVREWVGVHTDITDLRAAETGLKDADRRKDEFLATLAHELRNPLAPIRNALEILNQTTDAEIAVRARAMLSRQIGQMVRLVDDLLDISRITTGKLKLERQRLTVRQLVEQAIETARPQIDARRHTLVVEQPDEDVRVTGDVVRLAQIVTNLLNNAAKYTERGGTVTLRVSPPEGGRVRIEVRDTGIGIRPDVLPKVFELFAQVDAGDRSEGGLGIGLALATRLATMHGGSLSAASDGPGRGSTFTLELPVASAVGRRRTSPARPQDAPVEGRRIVIADDNRDAADSLSIMLRLEGHDVRTCYDGPSAIATIREVQPDAAILDLGMPGCDGFEVARAVRADPDVGATLLVALTGWGQEDDKRRTRLAGFDHHFTKPIGLDVLQKVLAPAADVRH